MPAQEAIPTPAAVSDRDDPTGYVVWHRKHLRTDDHLALERAVVDGDVVCPLFVFDPSFYSGDGLACDARLRFLHEALTSLDTLYAATARQRVVQAAASSTAQPITATPLDLQTDPNSRTDGHGTTLEPPDRPGMTFGYGDPATVLSAFVDRGWSVLTMATPTSRYGKQRDRRVRQTCDDAISFLSGDGLVRDTERPRENWQSQIGTWLTGTQHVPQWDDAVGVALETGVTPALVDEGYGIVPTKTKVPTGTHRDAAAQLSGFVDRIQSYPRNISAPQDAREGTSGLSPYINFGLLSVRQVHQYVTENAPACRGRKMFTSRLVWNMHYNQKLVDWPGWTEQAVNPVFENRNEETHDPELVTAWKRGQTGFPMVDASMRCLRQTGWLNFRMRAMCASFFTHILQQPWWIGADWYHHHLIDSDVGINYTQWQSQAGLVGKPSQRVYNPRKQVRDHDPDGEWITEWVPELSPLPSESLDRPERTPLAVQENCGVVVGEDYPRPVVDFEARREAFWSQYERRRARAAQELGRPAIARRASFSGGYAAAKAIANEHGRNDDTGSGTQVQLAEIEEHLRADSPAGRATVHGDDSETAPAVDADAMDDETTIPTGSGQSAGEPSPDDNAVVSDALETPNPTNAGGDTDSDSPDSSREIGDEQTTVEQFE
nr:cryptochrome/deoxyribodipyrimidine photo-lyase family protein [Halorientalis sp.]